MDKITISEESLAGIFGSAAAYQVLMFLQVYENGYASAIARTYRLSLSQVQKQLSKFELLGLLVSRMEGSSRVYYFKQSPITDALRFFLKTMLDELPEESIANYYQQRRRPRRKGKP